MHGEEPAEHRDDEQQGRNPNQLAGTHDGRHEHKEQAEQTAGQAWNGGQPVKLSSGQVESDCIKLWSNCGDQVPRGEANDENESGNPQCPPGNFGVPVIRFFWIPSLDDFA